MTPWINKYTLTLLALLYGFGGTEDESVQVVFFFSLLLRCTCESPLFSWREESSRMKIWNKKRWRWREKKKLMWGLFWINSLIRIGLVNWIRKLSQVTRHRTSSHKFAADRWDPTWHDSPSCTSSYLLLISSYTTTWTLIALIVWSFLILLR